MGFLQPNLPVVDHDTWHDLPREERMRPMARHFAEYGFGSPDVLILFYAVKIVVYAAVGWGLLMTVPGIDGPFDVSTWWDSPSVISTFVLWTMLFEVLGLGCGFGPLNLRFLPPMGSFLYWLRPGTIRLPPWPNRVPLTRGDTRTVVDVFLYAGLVASLALAVWGAQPRWQLITVLVFMGLIGLRDKAIFLAGRSEVYLPFIIGFMMVGQDPIVVAKLMFLTLWWGAATSKINKHFPFVVAAMESNSPVWRSARFKHIFHRDFPDDLRPSKVSGFLAHVGTVVEFGVPLVLFLSDGGIVTKVAAVVMIAFHLHILSSFPMGVPLEWNIFMLMGIVVMFVGNADVGLADVTNPWPIVALMCVVVGVVIFGNLVPSKVSFLPSMRYYAGNWAASVWCFRGDALERFDAGVKKASIMPHQQLEKMYGSMKEAMVPMHLGYSFRGMHTHGRALWSLVPRACGPEHEDYLVLDGELVAGTSLGWNFGDGHLHHEQLAAALQKRCDFQPGDVRVVFLESQPFHRQTQQYRLFDPATGEIERGYVRVDDLISRQPTATDVPCYVTPSPTP